MTSHRIIQGDCIEGLRTLPDASVHCCVTSPPYWGLRDYGHDGQIGLEATPESYVARMVEVFREVRRVLRDDGTCWVNLGDSYAANRPYQVPSTKGGPKHSVSQAAGGTGSVVPPGCKPKDLVGIPWRVAFALQADGWWLRQDIIWHKPNPMPESVRDRCTKAHEYVFLLTKSERYYYDADAIRQPLRWQQPNVLATNAQARQQKRLSERIAAGDLSALRTESDRRTAMNGEREKGRGNDANRERTLRENLAGANRRSVWTVTTKPYSGAHFATMPPDLVEPCILAGCPEQCCPVCGAGYERITQRDRAATRPGKATKTTGDSLVDGNRDPQRHITTVSTLGWAPACDCAASGTMPGTVLDPFAGSGTTLAVAAELGRSGIGCELNPEYIELAEQRIAKSKAKMPLFVA
jgi:DNA modification methylase